MTNDVKSILHLSYNSDYKLLTITVNYNQECFSKQNDLKYSKEKKTVLP